MSMFIIPIFFHLIGIVDTLGKFFNLSFLPTITHDKKSIFSNKNYQKNPEGMFHLHK